MKPDILLRDLQGFFDRFWQAWDIATQHYGMPAFFPEGFSFDSISGLPYILENIFKNIMTG
jgi:hypothetical protein